MFQHPLKVTEKLENECGQNKTKQTEKKKERQEPNWGSLLLWAGYISDLPRWVRRLPTMG